MEAAPLHVHGAPASNRTHTVHAYGDHVVDGRLDEPFKKQPRVTQEARKGSTHADHHVPHRACNVGEIGGSGISSEITHGYTFALLRS